MTIDPYSVCPGGTGKKIKFCCSDLVSDLDKIQRMIEGDQRVACLDHVAKLESKYPQRACLLSVRSILELSLDKQDEAAATIGAFLQKYPDNPVALSQLAVLKCRQGKPEAAIEPLLRAIEKCGDEINSNVYQAMTAVAVNLAAMRYFVPARALLLRQLAMAHGKDQRAAGMLMQIQSDPNLPVLIKDEADLEQPPEGAPWKFEFDVAFQRALRGEWRIAAEKFAALIPLAGQSPALWRNLSLLRGWLADYPGMSEALRKYAALDVPFDDATEAEALAQLIDKPSTDDDVEVIEAEYSVTNQTDVEERFAVDRQVERVPFDPRAWESDEDGEEVGPPPRAIFILIDRPIATTAVGLTHDQVSQVVATVQLFGRQTDRPERLVLQTERGELPKVEALVKRIGGDAIGERAGAAEKVIDRIGAVAHALQWDWRLPKDTTPQQRESLVAAERRERVLNRLPKTGLNQIGGQTLERTAADPKGRIRAAALILLLDLAIARQRDVEVYNDLRRQLGLPIPGPIDPTTLADIRNLPVARFSRLQVEKLADEPLLKVYRRMNMIGFIRAAKSITAEIVRRPSLYDPARFTEAYALLASLSETLEEALSHLDEARAISQKARESSARWDLDELQTRVQFNDLQGASRLFDHLRKEHIREEGIAEALGQILVSAGLVDSAGRLLLPPVAETSPILVPGAAAPGKILTPGSQPAAAERKSVLWTPGME